MTTINLDANFAPYGHGIQVNSFSFPSGCEPHIKLPLGFNEDKVKITCRIQTCEDIIRLILTVDAVKRCGTKNIELLIPYLPFARQDRVMVEGEPLSVKVMADLINAQGFSKVEIFDPHSEVCLALINNSVAISNHSFVDHVLKDKVGYFIVSPDAGAFKKIFKVCQHIDYYADIVLCNKQRCVSDGKISRIDVSASNFEGMDLYIIDDICDGGGTFILLAENLRKMNCGKINLIVSHGIFSKGVNAVEGIDHIYTTNSFRDHTSSEKLTQIKLTDGLLS